MRKDLYDWRRMFKGIRDERRAFCGPHTVQIDLTDKCNNNCIGCWVHSPLLDKKEIFPQGEKELPFNLVNNLIEELYRLGTQEIILSGSGEPFLYPRIKDVVKLIKSKGIYLNIITNLLLVDEDIAKILVKDKVDLITASIWAGSSQAYAQTHPGVKGMEFEKLKENLKRLAFYKNTHNSLLPHVKIYNVICSKNYDDIENMIDFAKETEADSVEFQVADIIEGKTDFLAIDDFQAQAIFSQFKTIRERRDMVFYDTPLDIPVKQFLEEEFSDFGKVWKDFQEGFQLSRYAERLICPKGYEGKRDVVSHMELHGVTEIGAFKYQFLFGKECDMCELNRDCFGKTGIKKKEVNLLNILSVGTLLRRISCKQKEKILYDLKVNSIPCYIGWYYARILTDGRLIPCCKAAGFPLGNILKQSFSQIWNSPQYKEFRFNAKNLSKGNKYFSKINCLKSCDNWGMNLEIHKRLAGLGIHRELKIIKKSELNKRNFLIIKAKDFVKGNLNPGYNHDFGKDLVIDGGQKWGFAEYEFDIDISQRYEFWSRYASGESRPVEMYIDGNLIKKNGLDKNTGGWTRKSLGFYEETEVDLDEGRHILRIYSPHCIPHIESFYFFKKGHLSSLVKKERKGSYFRTVNQYILKSGLKEALKKITHNLTPKNLKHRYLEILGIYDGEYGYKGPFHVQIDLTNNCNNQCIACWCNSPLLKEKRLSEEEKKQYLPLGLVKELLDEISQMGATEIYYSGSGEPFMHPQIMEVLKYTKKKGLTCHVNTNFTLLDRNKIDCLIDLGVDFLTVSVWAGRPKTYCRVHPGRIEEDFHRVKENLVYLNKKKKEKFNKPLIKIYEVLFNMNYSEVEEMIKFAEDTSSESIEFTLADTIPNKTDILRLNKDETQELIEICKDIKKRLGNDNRLTSGLLLFQFDQFLRRISVIRDVGEAKYDRNIIDRLPCYIGWLFARVIPNGEVHSCLKAHRIPTGSLYLNRFSEIWNSPKQFYFRKKTLVYEKNDPFFRLIGNDPYIKEAGCYKSCDDIGRNTWMHNRIQMLSTPERLVLKSIANVLKIVRRLRPKEDGYKRYHNQPIIAGILHGRRAFVGPEQVVIDPTNKCNLRCISCWLYSPLLTKHKPPYEWLKKELPKEALIKLIDDLSSLGTKRIRFTGGGEPFMHRDLMNIIDYARRKGLLVAISTNFGLVHKKDIKGLIDLGLEELCVSIWASESETYCRVHPGTTSLYFERLKENLLYLKEIKNEKPRVTFANVIMNSNFKDFEGMYKFGLDYGADAIYFTIADVFIGQTDKLLLNGNERRGLLEKALKIKQMSQRDNIQLEFFDGFLRRISKSQNDFERGEYDKFDIDKIPCYVGWIFSRILADGSVVPCCRGVRKIMGNINRTAFKDIWFSSQYNEFRAKAKYLSKSDSYFKDIGCIKECDNLMHNEQMHRRLNVV